MFSIAMLVGPPVFFGYCLGRLHNIDLQMRSFEEGLHEGLKMSGIKIETLNCDEKKQNK
jgi:hypothetical protein